MTTPDALPDLRTMVERLRVHYRRNGCASSTVWVTRRDVLALIPEGAVLVTEEARDALLGELMESPLPGARYAHSIVEHWLARLRDTQP